MKCKDCYARNSEEICLIGKKPRMLVCGHYGCDLQARAVEKRMGIEKSQTNGDRIRSMSDEKLADFIWKNQNLDAKRSYSGWCEWLKQEEDEE